MKLFVIPILFLAAIASAAFADGKMYWPERVLPEIPHQRALILFDEGTQTLVLQSKYEIPKGDNPPPIGWVVPVPAVPELASMPADSAEELFMDLARRSTPRVTEVWPTVFGVLLVTVTVGALATLLLCLLSLVLPRPAWLRRNREPLARYAILVLFGCFVAGILLPGLGRRQRADGVDLIAEERVGIYDVSVVRSDSAERLVAWLNERNFKFGDGDTAAFESHVSKGWCFVAAMINPSVGEAKQRVVSEGLAAPLILRFPSPNPIYPLALTATGGFETEVLIYLASSSKMTCKDRMTLRFAGNMPGKPLLHLEFETTPKGFFDAVKMDFPYLCKFKDTLTPDQMREDIVFTKAEDDEPYREHIVRW